MNTIRIGTRGSNLALWQANMVAEQLRQVAGSKTVELVIIQTQGDQVQNKPLAQIGGDGLFTKAIQDALLAGQVDVAVHSLKDLPTAPVAGLSLAAVPPRGPVGDAFVSRTVGKFADLAPGARVATGSTRRRAQILFHRPDLALIGIRGNVDTRLRRLSETGLDGLILAQAGLVRLGLASAITEIVDSDWMLPAVGQGALGLECREEDAETARLLGMLDDATTHQAVRAERALLLGLGGGCQIPLGAIATVSDEGLLLRATVTRPDGKQQLADRIEGPAYRGEELGRTLAQRLLADGARELLR